MYSCNLSGPHTSFSPGTQYHRHTASPLRHTASRLPPRAHRAASCSPLDNAQSSSPLEHDRARKFKYVQFVPRIPLLPLLVGLSVPHARLTTYKSDLPHLRKHKLEPVVYWSLLQCDCPPKEGESQRVDCHRQTRQCDSHTPDVGLEHSIQLSRALL